MRISQEKLEQIEDLALLKMYERGIELKVKDSGNGQSPYDLGQLEQEILKRMGKPASVEVQGEGGEIHPTHNTDTFNHRVYCVKCRAVDESPQGWGKRLLEPCPNPPQ